MNVHKPRVPPALLLFLLSPAIGELLSGSSPPAEFFSPFNFLLLVSLYGSGAVLMRELKVRWKKGIGSLLLLGAAYGVLEEGLMVTSFFSPYWIDLGSFATYGRWLGVNWVWAEMLTIYHAVYSIAVPIVLVETAFPDQRDAHWVGKKLLTALVALLLTVTILGNILLSYMMQYWTPLPQQLFAATLIVFFVYAARKLSAEWGLQGQRMLPKARLFWAIASAASFAFFLGFYILPSGLPWQLLMLYGLLLVFMMVRFLKRYNWREKAHDMHVLALSGGALSFMIVFAVLQELDKSRADNTAGMSLVGLASAICLAWLGTKVKKRRTPTNGTKPQQPQVPR